MAASSKSSGPAGADKAALSARTTRTFQRYVLDQVDAFVAAHGEEIGVTDATSFIRTAIFEKLRRDEAWLMQRDGWRQARGGNGWPEGASPSWQRLSAVPERDNGDTLD